MLVGKSPRHCDGVIRTATRYDEDLVKLGLHSVSGKPLQQRDDVLLLVVRGDDGASAQQ
jgi:hypothetical protein